MAALDFPSSPTNGDTYSGFYWDASTGAWRSDPVPMGGLPAGSIIQWAGATAPANWLIADGAAVSRTTYASLFAAIGTTYGAGDGSTTFNLPDLRGRVPVGKNSGTFATLGASGGAETHTHSHGSSQMIAALWPGFWKNRGNATTWYATNSGGITAPGSASNASNAGPSIEGNTDNATVSTLSPYLVTNYIIKATSGWSAGDSELATRIGVLEAAPAGLVAITPTQVDVGSGSATISGKGKVTFSNVSAIRLRGVFGSNSLNYRLVANISMSNTATLRFRFSSGGTDNSTAVYGWGGTLGNSSGTTACYSGLNVDWGAFGDAQASNNNLIVADIAAPYDSGSLTKLQANTQLWNGAWVGGYIANAFNSYATFDGIILYPTAGTYSGTVQVYGYRN